MYSERQLPAPLFFHQRCGQVVSGKEIFFFILKDKKNYRVTVYPCAYSNDSHRLSGLCEA